MSAIQDIRSRGHWVVQIHPAKPLSQPPSLGELANGVRSSAVALRGWDFPHWDTNSEPVRTQIYVEQCLAWEHFREIWRVYRSGQFVSVSALWGDWRDISTIWPADASWRKNGTLGVEDAVFRLVEIYEFASRWAQAFAMEDPITVRILLKGLASRNLEFSPRRGGRSWSKRYTASCDQWTDLRRLRLAELVAGPRENAVLPTLSLLELFAWDVSRDVVRDIQTELRR